jgi:DNA-binding NarL/FixJ family response regulator
LLLAWRHDETRIVIDAIEAAAILAVLMNRNEDAARLFAAVDRQRMTTGIVRWLPRHLANYERSIAAVQATLDATAHTAASTAGRELSLEQAVAAAIELAAPPPVRLTAREIEVARLLVAEKTDREIAGALFISVRTVEHHVARIFDKLGVHTRTAAANLIAAHTEAA